MISLSAAHGQQAQRQCFTWNISQTTSVTAPRFLIARRPVLVHTATPDAIDMIPDFVPDVEKRGSTEEKYDDQLPEIEISHSHGRKDRRKDASMGLPRFLERLSRG